MEYTVSDKIQQIFDKVTKLPEIQAALDYVKEDHPYSIEEHKTLIACEAPTFHEENRARMYAGLLSKYGLENVTVREDGNVTGLWRGAGGGPTILVEGHMDTVFPLGSVKEIIDNGSEIHAPGSTDDTRGLSAILAALRAMKAAGIETRGDIIFAGTVREEGMGSLGGMRELIRNGPHFDASVSVDGAGCEKIHCDATGFRTYEVVFRGKSGHVHSHFGQFGSALHAAALAAAGIADMKLPAEPKCTFGVTGFHGGNDSGIHTISPEAVIKFNFRSEDQKALEELDKKIFGLIDEAAREESSRYGGEPITWESRRLCDVPAGRQDHHLPIVEAGVLAGRYVCDDPEKVFIPEGGSVNGNMAIAAGIPAITMGGGFENKNIHSLDEYFPYTEGYRLPRQIVLVLAMLAGIAGKSEPL